MKYGKRLIILLLVICISFSLKRPFLNAKENNKSNFTEKMYGIGSVSKVFTAAAIMKLVQEGKIDLDIPIIKYIPEFYMKDLRYKKITTRMLLNHSSGLQGSSFKNVLLLGDNDTFQHDTLLEQLSKQRLKADPGVFPTYCNDGFSLAEILIERVSGKSFTEYLEQNFWNIMGIFNIKTPQSVFDYSKLAKVYFRSNSDLTYETTNAIGSGGIYATAEELCLAAQMFVNNSKSSFNLLSDQSKDSMETNDYIDRFWNMQKEKSSISYGLGWDNVEDATFSDYGIKALVKGGDTMNYHANLTVLPEMNISCAVLSSGGDSQLNELAAKEILITYLKETGQLQTIEETENTIEYAKIPSQMQQYEGWYGARGIFRVEIKDEILYLSSIGTKHDTIQQYRYTKEGEFISTNGEYISLGGEMLASENGIKGETKITFEEEKGKVYLMISTLLDTPGLGTNKVSAPFAQKISAYPLSDELKAVWEKRDNKEYLLVDEKYTSQTYLENPSVRVKLFNEPAGYVDIGDGKIPVTKIQNKNRTEFFQEIPGQSGRDLKDCSFLEKDNIEYLYTQDGLYILNENIQVLDVENNSIVIDKDGFGKWFTIGEEWKNTAINLHCPENGAFYIYNCKNDEMTCVASSVTKELENIYLPEGGKIVFVGEAGAKFEIEKVNSKE